MQRTALAPIAAVALVGCGATPAPSTTHEPASAAPSEGARPVTFDRVAREDLNRMAMRLNLPLFWAADTDQDGAVDPDEVRALRFYPTQGTWVDGSGQFTAEFRQAYEAIASQFVTRSGAPPYPPADRERQQLVWEEFNQAAPTLVDSDLTSATDWERTFVGHMMEVAQAIDALYATQTGMNAFRDRIPEQDVASRSLLRRNWGPACLAPATETNPACSAVVGSPKPVVGVYPASLQQQENFCARLEEHPRASELLAPFVVIRGENWEELTALPYTEAFSAEMTSAATALRRAAAAIPEGEEEKLRAYLGAAAQAFEDNRWEPADEAWAQMNARNSGWYVRVGPDETYWEPCSHKAGFHLTLARINRDSLRWQDALSPHVQTMERGFARLIGRPYRPRTVRVHVPDFIDIVANAGDDRTAFGATIGQSLPNWGPVAAEGRGRTVAMSNLFQDADSRRSRRDQAASMLGSEALAIYGDDATPGLLSTILHELTHNLGPAQEYRVGGKPLGEVFGGGMASMLEELKAQSGALHYVELLRSEGIIDDALARTTYLDSVVWAFGHISRGMYTPGGQRKAYSQLAAIQVGFLMDEGVIAFDAETMAGNGSDRGAFRIDFARFPAAAEKLIKEVGTIMARGDRAAAEALAERYVDGTTVPQAVITERYRRQPKASLVYSVSI